MSIVELVHERGPLTVAAFMDLALYDSRIGYYARAARRSGPPGDFFTSVDVGPIFGELVEIQLAEMAEILASASDAGRAFSRAFDLVEAGAGNGQLAADILRAARRHDPSFYNRLRLHLVEASPLARAAQSSTLGEVGERLATSAGELPFSFEGALVANELLDAFPVHQVVMHEDGLREVYVHAVRQTVNGTSGGGLVTREGGLSTPALANYLAHLKIALEPGWRAEINLRAVEWMREVARRLRRGFIVIIDYGHEARELYSATHAGGTLTTFARHTMAGPDAPGGAPPWLDRAGDRDITAHVDFTSVRAAAEAEGMRTLGFLDQTYFLMGLLTGDRESFAVSDARMADLANDSRPLKTLLLPGSLGSTHKVLILGKGVGLPALRGCSYRMRVT
jgi:SAM-dependent MidA family methyltransferase